jgi:isoprenylcysteine carboxyl methyltransferase (ICMT) family protein YpbQ
MFFVFSSACVFMLVLVLGVIAMKTLGVRWELSLKVLIDEKLVKDRVKRFRDGVVNIGCRRCLFHVRDI